MHSFEPLGDLLVQLQLLGGEQWSQVQQALPPDATLAATLEQLEQLPAWWADRPTPALTSYQRKCILRHYPRKDLSRLQRKLRWGDYLILAELGEGGMGVVHKGWDLGHQRLVAIKRIKSRSVEMHRRFRREARIQRRLQHSCIAQLLELTRWRGATLLILEYIEGRTLAQEVKTKGPTPWRAAARWTLDILHALAFAHRLKIIHRDIKPSNIMLPQQPAEVTAKLLDMGLAKCLDPTAMTQSTGQAVLTAGDSLLGTFEYMAPEQWRGADAIVPASDVYSLGCSFFFALTGRPPFLAETLVGYCNAHTHQPPPRLASADAPPALEVLVQQMLAKDPAQRGSPVRLIRHLEKLLGPEALTPRAQTGPKPDRKLLPSPAQKSAPTPQPFQGNASPSGTAPCDPEEERFLPFPSARLHNVAGMRALLRAFLLGRGRTRRLLCLLFAALGLLGILFLCLRS